ncbi:MAG: hypothetical protein IIY77_09395 [Lachnospiraceae bacterium]|nr:hypothetical protein [Lachnospiraceae bacterium]
MKKELLEQANRFFFNKKEKVIFPENREPAVEPLNVRLQTAAGMLTDLDTLGYAFPEEEAARITDLSTEDMALIYRPLLQAARTAKGADVEHRLLFRNFPEDVKNTDIDTLSDIRFFSYFTTIVDILTGREALKDGLTRSFVDEVMARERKIREKTHKAQGQMADELKNVPKIITVHLGTEDEFFDMVRSLLGARSSLSDYDKELVSWMIGHFDQELYLPDKVVFKETQAFLDREGFRIGLETGSTDHIDIKTLKDFKRLLAVLSEKDVSLSEKLIIRKFSPDEERLLSRIFARAVRENYPLMMESMQTRRAQRFRDTVLYGRNSRLHFEEKADRRLIGAFFKAAEKQHSKMHDYEEALAAHDYPKAADILYRISPTLLIQHVRELAGKAWAWKTESGVSENEEPVKSLLQLVKKAAEQVDIKTLLSCEQELKPDRENYKFIIPKGSSINLIVKENKSAVVPEELSADLISCLEEGIASQIRKVPPLVENGTGMIYIDPVLAACPIPSDGNKETSVNRAVAVGTHLPVETGRIMRAWLYKQADRDQFIDFSCAFLNSDYRFVGQVSWNNLKEGDFAFHSGDTAACSGDGCTEVIDVDLQQLKELHPDARYIAYQVLMWDRVPVNSANRIFAAFAPAQRVGEEQGKKLEKDPMDICSPLDVRMKVDVRSEAANVVPLLFDIDAQELIYLNVPLKKGRTLKELEKADYYAENNRHFELPEDCEKLEKYASDFALLCYALESTRRPSIKDLADRYVLYGGYQITEEKEKADVLFLSDRTESEDRREPLPDGETRGPRLTVTPYDRDIIMGKLIPEAARIKEVKE